PRVLPSRQFRRRVGNCSSPSALRRACNRRQHPPVSVPRGCRLMAGAGPATWRYLPDLRPGARAIANARALVTRFPLHFAVIAIALVWSIPTLALLVSSFRQPSDIAISGWWHAIDHLGSLTLANYRA